MDYLRQYLREKDYLKNQKMTFEKERFESYLYEVRKVSINTVKIYMSYFNNFDTEKTSEVYIREFIGKHGNIPAVRGFIKAYLESLEIDLEELNIKLPKPPTGRKKKRIPRIITDEEINKLKTSFYKQSFRDGLIFDLMYQGALRRFEVPTIKLNAFEWKLWDKDTSKFCRLKIKGKGNKERIVLIDPRTVEKIRNHYIMNFDLFDEDLFYEFINRGNLLFNRGLGDDNKARPMTEKQIYDIIKSSKNIIGRDIRPHELRHHRATELQNMNTPVEDIQVYLGHSKIQTTMGYLHKTGEKSLKNVEENLKRSKNE